MADPESPVITKKGKFSAVPRRKLQPGEKSANANLLCGDNRVGNGRPVGSVNKVTKLVRESATMAAEAEGNRLYKMPDPTPDEPDRKLVDFPGTRGYLQYQARINAKTFVSMLTRLIPVQIDTPKAVDFCKVTSQLSSDEIAAYYRD